MEYVVEDNVSIKMFHIVIHFNYFSGQMELIEVENNIVDGMLCDNSNSTSIMSAPSSSVFLCSRPVSSFSMHSSNTDVNQEETPDSSEVLNQIKRTNKSRQKTESNSGKIFSFLDKVTEGDC